jgi:hypothetical protein
MADSHGLTCKHVPAGRDYSDQVENLVLCCKIGKEMGATPEMIAGAMATMIQESDAHNNPTQDQYGSAGLYAQQARYYGGYAAIMDRERATKAFYTTYLPYCRRGMDVISASDHTQHSAYPTAPAQWLSESRRNVQIILGSSKDFGDISTGGINFDKFGTKSITRNKPYEFSRGSAGQPENSWDCMGRLADEVQWNRFMRAGELWYASEDWLSRQSPRFVFATGARGVISITFDSDARRDAASCTVTALAKRWSVLPGDVVTVQGQGPADGLWLVSGVNRKLTDDTSTITLKRPQKALPEPAPETETSTVNVGGINSIGIGSASGDVSGKTGPIAKVYLAAKAMSDRHLPYIWGGGHGAAGVATSGGFDCSGSCVAVLAAANLGYHPGGPTDVSGGMAAHWGSPGQGRFMTVWANYEHVWIQFKGFPAWRFDTSTGGGGACGGSGPQLRFCARSTSGFTPRHWDPY